MEANNQILYDADLYLRLSREDGDKAESESIAGQRDLLLSFLEKHPEIRLHSIRVDDGYSGVNFDRPDFIKMRESVKNKEITVSLSRIYPVWEEISLRRGNMWSACFRSWAFGS